MINSESQQLSNAESRDLELLLYENFQPGHFCEEDVGRDFIEIRKLTAEIRSIHKQHIVLLGERICRARDILQKYGDGATFTEWLDKIFTSRRTAYNIIRYYEFYEQLPSLTLKASLKRMPLKVAYCLSSRQAPLKQKVEIIENYAGEKPDDAILLIKERLPAAETDRRRKDSNKLAIDKIRQFIGRLKNRREYLSEMHIHALQEIQKELSTICEFSN